MAKLTQCDRILRHMEDYGPIDPMVAILKGQGYDIVSDRTKGTNRYGEQTSYCTYRLINKEVSINA